LPLESLLRHAVLLGASGSGKSVFGKAIVEEAIAKRLPVIVVDTQGDLASLALGVTDNDKSLSSAKFEDRVDVKIWTPGSTAGIPVSMTPTLTIPGKGRPEDRARTCTAIGRALAHFINDTSEITATGLAMIVDWANQHRVRLDAINELVKLLTAPPMALLTAPPMALLTALAPLLDKRDAAKLAKMFLVKTIGPAGHLASLGNPLDPDELFGLYAGPGEPSSKGKARLSIVSLAALQADERQQFVAALCTAIYRWMVTLDGGAGPWMLFIDECSPYLPPVMKPVAKEPLSLLLRQARKFAVGIVLATQSPGDLDFTCLGQVGTVAIGKLSTRQEIQKIAPALAAHGASPELLASLPTKQPGEFVIMSHALTSPVEFQARRTITPHRIVGIDEIEQLVSDDDRAELGGMRTISPAAAPAS